MNFGGTYDSAGQTVAQFGSSTPARRTDDKWDGAGPPDRDAGRKVWRQGQPPIRP